MEILVDGGPVQCRNATPKIVLSAQYYNWATPEEGRNATIQMPTAATHKKSNNQTEEEKEELDDFLQKRAVMHHYGC